MWVGKQALQVEVPGGARGHGRAIKDELHVVPCYETGGARWQRNVGDVLQEVQPILQRAGATAALSEEWIATAEQGQPASRVDGDVEVLGMRPVFIVDHDGCARGMARQPGHGSKVC